MSRLSLLFLTACMSEPIITSSSISTMHEDKQSTTSTANIQTKKTKDNTSQQSYDFFKKLQAVTAQSKTTNDYSEKILACINLQSKSTNYKAPMLAIHDDKIFAAEHNTVYTYSNEDAVSFYQHAYPITAIYVTEQFIYVADERGNLIIVDQKTKAVAEIPNLHTVLNFIEQDDKLLAISNNGSITCFDKNSGVIIWYLESTLTNDSMYKLNIQIDNGLIYTFSSALTLSIVDLNSGNILKTLLMPYNLLANVHVDNKKIYCITDHMIYSIDKFTHKYLTAEKISYQEKKQDEQLLQVSPEEYTQTCSNKSDLFIITDRTIYKLNKENMTLLPIFQSELYNSLTSTSYIVSAQATDKYLFVNTTTDTICINLDTYDTKVLSHNVLNISKSANTNYMLGIQNTIIYSTKLLLSFV